MNVHVELARKWLEDNDSVTIKELHASRKEAWKTDSYAAADIANAAFWAASNDPDWPVDNDGWAAQLAEDIKKYDELVKEEELD